MKWAILIILAGSFFFNCSPKIEKEKSEPVPEKTVTREEATASIPCFKCHDFQKFSSKKKAIGFSHLVHKDAGYHCNQCHESKPHRYIKTSTALCNDCHNLKTFIYKDSGFEARFNHELHAKAGCKECHPALFQMKKGSAKMTMEPMYQGKQCGSCHNGKAAFASTECSKCHSEMKAIEKDFVYKVEAVGNAVFSHKFHTNVFTCKDCHPKVFAMKKSEGKMPMAEMEKGKHCGACHNGNKASNLSDCTKCHK